MGRLVGSIPTHQVFRDRESLTHCCVCVELRMRRLAAISASVLGVALITAFAVLEVRNIDDLPQQSDQHCN